MGSLDREVTLRLDGHVTGAGVGLLRDSAEVVLGKGTELRIDLENIRFIDCEGVVLIKTLMERGAQLVKAPLFVTEQIKKCES